MMYKLGNLEVNTLRKRKVYDKQVLNYREKHIIEIKNVKTGLSENFEYTTQTLQYIPKDKNKILENALWCIFMDYGYISMSEYEFINKLGYDEEEGEKVYNDIQNNNYKFDKLLDYKIIEELNKHYENY